MRLGESLAFTPNFPPTPNFLSHPKLSYIYKLSTFFPNYQLFLNFFLISETKTHPNFVCVCVLLEAKSWWQNHVCTLHLPIRIQKACIIQFVSYHFHSRVTVPCAKLALESRQRSLATTTTTRLRPSSAHAPCIFAFALLLLLHFHFCTVLSLPEMLLRTFAHQSFREIIDRPIDWWRDDQSVSPPDEWHDSRQIDRSI